MPEFVAAVLLGIAALAVAGALAYVIGFVLTVPVSFVVAAIRGAKEHPVHLHRYHTVGHH